MIYAIEAVGLNRVKFGRAKNPVARFRSLSTGSPFPLRLVAAVDWPDDHETIIHDAFAGARTHGEWFHLTYPVGEFVQTLMCPSATFDEKYRACMEIIAEQGGTGCKSPDDIGQTSGEKACMTAAPCREAEGLPGAPRGSCQGNGSFEEEEEA